MGCEFICKSNTRNSVNKNPNELELTKFSFQHLFVVAWAFDDLDVSHIPYALAEEPRGRQLHYTAL